MPSSCQCSDYRSKIDRTYHVSAAYQGIFDAIDRAMTKFDCPDWNHKVIAMGSDGASVNSGINDSATTPMQADGRDYVLPVHCVAHHLELGVLSAIKENRMLFIVHDMLNKMHTRITSTRLKHCEN